MIASKISLLRKRIPVHWRCDSADTLETFDPTLLLPCQDQERRSRHDAFEHRAGGGEVMLVQGYEYPAQGLLKRAVSDWNQTLRLSKLPRTSSPVYIMLR
jgi:hypothetical protein